MSGDTWNRLAKHWKECGIDRSGADVATIDAFEKKYGVRLPADVRSYFETIDGTGDEDPDNYRFWPLNEVKPVHEELSDIHSDRYSYPDCFVFADYLVWCWAYAVRLVDDPAKSGAVYLVTGGNPPGEMKAQTFKEFAEKYLAAPTSLFP